MRVNAFDGFGGRLELLLHGGIVDAGVVLGHVQGLVTKQLAHRFDGQAVIDKLGGESVAQLMRGDLDPTLLAPTPQLITHGFIREQAVVIEPQMIISGCRTLRQVSAGR